MLRCSKLGRAPQKPAVGHNADMHAYYADQFVLPLPQNHRFPMAKYRMLRDRIAEHLPDVSLRPALLATESELALVHTDDYIAQVATGALSAAVQRDIGFPWSEAMAERARRSVGATVAASRAAQQSGVAGNLAGGTHHAYADRGSGFCVFNDVAVAARCLQAEHGQGQGAQGDVRRAFQVAVVDLDVHQGNGTADIFKGDSSVFTLSMHGARNFPFRKEASDLDVELPDKCEDDEYLHALDLALEALDQRCNPDFVFYLAGADPHVGDRLGRLAVTHDGLEARDRRVFDWAWQRRIPVAFAMAGGYGNDLQDTITAQLNTWRVAMQYHQRWQNTRP